MQLSFVMTHLSPPGMVRHCCVNVGHFPSKKWHRVQSFTHDVRHTIPRGVRHCRSLYLGASICIQVFYTSQMRFCFGILHRGQSLSADVSHCTDAHVGHGTVKSDAHQTSDSPSPGVIGGSLQMTAALLNYCSSFVYIYNKLNDVFWSERLLCKQHAFKPS